MKHLVIVGPTSTPWAQLATSVEDDLRHLRRPGLEIAYVTTGAGPECIRTREDELAAGPHVVATAVRIADSCDAIVVDCTGDPGVAAARRVVDVPVIGAGEAARRAARRAPEPVVFLSGDAIRAASPVELRRAVGAAATVVVNATGHRRVVDALRDDGVNVIEPLEAAVGWCVELLTAPS